MLLAGVGSNSLVQFGQATLSCASTMGLACSALSSEMTAEAAVPRDRFGTTDRMALSEKTHPQLRRAMNGIAPFISLRDKGQMKGALSDARAVVEVEVAT